MRLGYVALVEEQVVTVAVLESMLLAAACCPLGAAMHSRHDVAAVKGAAYGSWR
jgi:hypothetical protein